MKEYYIKYAQGNEIKECKCKDLKFSDITEPIVIIEYFWR